MRSLKKLKPEWPILLSAVLIVLSFPPWNFAFLLFASLIPWFWTLSRCQTLKAAVLQGTWLALLVTNGGFYWVTYSMHHFGNLPWVLAVLFQVLYTLVCQPQFIVFSVILFYFYQTLLPHLKGPKYLVASLFLAFLYTGLDWASPKLFQDTLGNAVLELKNLRQMGDIGGAFFLTFFLFVINDALHRFFFVSRKKETAVQLAFAAMFVLLGYQYGVSRNSQLDDLIKNPEKEVTFGVIQGQTGDFEKLAAEKGVGGAADAVLANHFELSDKALKKIPKPDVLLWPETTYPSTFRTPYSTKELARDQRLERWVQSRNLPLIFGTYDHEEEKDYNAIFVLYPSPQKGVPTNPKSQADLQIYRKNVLLPFGEYVPGMENNKWFRSTFPQMGFFGRGPGPEVIDVKLVESSFKIGPIVCFEALLPYYTIGAARKGNQVIVNVTNDSWFGPYAEPHQHLALAAMRSIEARLPQVRSTNSGVSALILPNGEMIYKTDVYKKETANWTVPIIKPMNTLMIKWGDWFGKTSLILGILGFFWGLVFTFRRR